MEKINTLLERFKKITIPNEAERRSLAEIILEETKIEIEIKDISIKNYIAYIKSSGGVKSEIFIKKRKILDKLNQNKNPKIVVDIR